MHLTRIVAITAMAVFAVTAVAGCAGEVNDPDRSPPEYTQEELESRATYLAELALALQLESPPEVELVRMVGREEWATVQLACLNDAGFPVTLLADGEGIDPGSVPESQRQPGGPFSTAMYICEAKFSSAGAAGGTLTDGQLAILYEWYVTESIPCLEAQGVTVSPPPSRQAFIETYFTSAGWYPYGSVDAEAITMEDWHSLNASCPQAPPDSLLGH